MADDKAEDICIVCKKDVDDDLVVFCDGDCNTCYHAYCFNGCVCCGKKAAGQHFRTVKVPEGDWFCKFCQGRIPDHGDQPIITYAYGFGSNEGKQLGLDSTTLRFKTPTLIPDLKGIGIKDLQIGGWNTMLLTLAGTVYTCGDGECGKNGHPGIIHEHLKRFRLVEGLLRENRVRLDGPIVGISCGRSCMFVVTSEGNLYNWGSGTSGILGHQSNTNKKEPVKISAFTQGDIWVTPMISIGWEHVVCVEERTGATFSWGSNRFGQIGYGGKRQKWIPQILNPSRERIHGLPVSIYEPMEEPCILSTELADLKCGKSHTLALEKDGRILSWGCGGTGQLGHGEDKETANKQSYVRVFARNVIRPTVIEFFSRIKITLIAAGSGHSMALCGGTSILYTWGLNRFGQLGNGKNKTCYLPQPIQLDPKRQSRVPFQFIRFKPLQLRVNGGNLIQLSQFQFFDSLGKLIVVQNVGNPGGANPIGETADKAIDGSLSTKWLDGTVSPIVFDLGQPIVVSSYRWCTANDAPERDPVQWILEGSANQLEWTVMHNHSSSDSSITEVRNTYTPKFHLSTDDCAETIIGIYAGDNHNFVLTHTNSLYAWGCGKSGQLGLGSLADYNKPQKLEVDFPDSKHSSEYNFQIRIGGNHSIIWWEHKIRKEEYREQYSEQLEEDAEVARDRLSVKKYDEERIAADDLGWSSEEEVMPVKKKHKNSKYFKKKEEEAADWVPD